MSVFRITQYLSCLALAMGFLTAPVWASALQAEKPTQYHDAKTGLTIITGDVLLEGWHFPVQADSGSPLSQPESIDHELVDNGEYDDKDGDMSSMTAKRRIRIAALLRDPDASSATLTLYRPVDKYETTVKIDLTEAKKNPGQPEDLGKWAQARHRRWLWRTKNPSSMIIDFWQPKGEQIYGVHFSSPNPFNTRWPERDSDMDLGTMALFGGQVAINETLQTQLLSPESTEKSETPETLPVSSLDGVSVESHPYAEMAQMMKTTEPPPSLADYVPTDRMMILMHDPERFAGIFDIDSAVLTRLTSASGNSFVDYDLLHRYAARFGTTPKQISSWLSSGMTTEIALFTPDVFFLDNTDITLVISLRPNVVGTFVSRMTDFGFDLNGTAAIPLAGGDSFHAALRQNRLVVSTSKSELDSALKLVEHKGKGSLGRSSEFRVMTHELPLMSDAGIYFYFSDPFIRRLTGPEVKINQLRRALMRTKMQDITATSLLYRLDHGEDGSLDAMKAKGYLTDEQARDFTLEKNAVVRHATWGTLEKLGTLLENPLTTVTAAEAAAYRHYVSRYEDFWSEYFDPIAVRLDLPAGGEFSLETFILPLIHNSIYTDLKKTLGTERPEKMSLPQYETLPIMSMALQVPDKRFLRDFFRSERSPLSYQALQLLRGLGTTVVFSIQDDAPIIQTNYPGSPFETLDRRDRFFGMNRSELLLLPVITALFSRPVDLAIEITDEALVRKVLDSFSDFNEDFVRFEHVVRKSDGTHVVSLSVADVIRMEYSLRVEHGWLHISNHPWSVSPIVGNRSVAPSQAALELTPSAMKKGLPQTASLVQSIYRNAVFASALELLPWMEAFGVDPLQATTLQKKSLGRATPLPPEVTLATKPFLEAKPYGSAYSKEIPANADDLIALPALPDIRLWMRFEGNGLRSRLDFISEP